MTEDRWNYLEDVLDACAVVSSRMELLFLNRTGRALVPKDRFGSHCWQAFPMVNQTCSVRCEAIRAVRESDEIVYCQEVIKSPNGGSRTLGVAVIPAGAIGEGETQSLLVLRPCPGDPQDSVFKTLLLEDATRIREDLKQGSSAGSTSRTG